MIEHDASTGELQQVEIFYINVFYLNKNMN